MSIIVLHALEGHEVAFRTEQIVAWRPQQGGYTSMMCNGSWCVAVKETPREIFALVTQAEDRNAGA